MKYSLKKYLFMMGIALLCLLASGLLLQMRSKEVDVDKYVASFKKAFTELDKQAASQLQILVGQFQDESLKEKFIPSHVEETRDRLLSKGMAFVVLENGQAVYWSHNSLPLKGEIVPEDSLGIMHLKNGWYAFRQHRQDQRAYLLFTIIQYDFRYQNRFLINRFHPALNLPEDVFYLTDRENVGFSIKDEKGKHLFSLALRRETGLTEDCGIMHNLSLLLAITGLIIMLFCSFRYFSVRYQRGSPLQATAAFAGVMLLARIISFVFQTPGVFYDDILFSPALYATSAMLPSLGDLFLNVFLLSVMAFFLFTHTRQIPVPAQMKKGKRLALAIGVFVLIYLFCVMAIKLIEGLVINSHLNLNVNFIFNLDVFSLIGFLIIGSIFFGFFFISVVLCRLASAALPPRSHFVLIYLITLGVLALLHLAISGPMLLQGLLFLSALAVYEMERKSLTPQSGFVSLLMSVFLFSLISTVALYRFNKEKEQENSRSMALQLASEQDPVAEFLFLELEETLFNDNQLKNLVLRDPYNESAIYRYLLYHYFYDFWAKYDLQVTICQPHEPLLLKPTNIQVECAWFFDDYISSYGQPTISLRFVYLDNNTGRNSYITCIPVSASGPVNEDSPDFLVFLEFDAKFVSRDLGFPELLIDEKININRELVNYSHAFYKDGMLINKYGPFIYSMDASIYGPFTEEFTTFEHDDFQHLVYRKDAHTLIFISRPVNTFLERIAPFSYLFVLFFILIVIYWLFTRRQKIPGLFRLNFKKRVQYSMILIVFASLATIGGASAWFLFSIYQNKNLAFLNEKTHSVLVEMEQLLAGEPVLDENLEVYLHDLLLSLSNTFFTDINLYNPDGQLLASSRSKVFEEGLVGEQMDPVAYSYLRSHMKTQFVHSERIGQLEYLSSYISLRNNFQELLGYINLPYFSKQGELRSEISYFLVAFINIYLLLLVAAVMLALFISNYITQPLQLIRDSLSRVQLGRSNEKIRWPREDEIGSLISEYNRMIDELSASAEIMARSERESAWREMAKQVAHEIKNPLTPMRLSVQYLEKAYKEKQPDWEERLERFSRTMVEQIDSLSVIAGAFSDFAKMPAGKNDKIDIKTLIPELLQMYQDFEKLTINLEMPKGQEPLWVQADKNQLLRVFNNLIRNAIQSYKKGQTAIIDIRCEDMADAIKVEVKDYGCGIPEGLKQNIYSPNFTTKTGGMGLGLSIVRSIIESIGGRAGFHSEEGQGSIFYFRLPKIKER